MDTQQHAFATDVANDLQKTDLFGIDDALVIIELVYYSTELFKTCFPNPQQAKTYLTSNYNGGEFAPNVMRPAVRQVRRGARKQSLDLTDEQIEATAKATLLRAMNAGDNVVTACYAATPLTGLSE